MDWSPKGKQLVVIKKNCELVQYKPDLSVAKYPKLQEMKTVKGWLSKIPLLRLILCYCRPRTVRIGWSVNILVVNLRVSDRS